jgi:hypothetical protein
MANEITFGECLRAAASIPEFVENFDRLMGTSLSRWPRRSPLDRMIDEGTGREREEALKFCAFVYETVYLRLPREATR